MVEWRPRASICWKKEKLFWWQKVESGGNVSPTWPKEMVCVDMYTSYVYFNHSLSFAKSFTSKYIIEWFVLSGSIVRKITKPQGEVFSYEEIKQVGNLIGFV